MSNKIFDCVTFFQENIQFELRVNILNHVVDKFIVCESIFDHAGKKKKINFNPNLYPNFKNKILHLILEKPFPEKNNRWQNQAIQREYLFNGFKDADENDLIMFSDPDEIPNPLELKKINLEKKIGIFMQKMFTYKLNLFNPHESPWEGTRISKKKNLKSIDWLRQKVLVKNLKYPFWRFDKEKSIQIIQNGGWHFNYLHTPEEISYKLNTFAHSQWSNKDFTEINNIKNKISNNEDLFNRGHRYNVVKNLDYLPDYIKKNLNKYSDWIKD